MRKQAKNMYIYDFLTGKILLFLSALVGELVASSPISAGVVGSIPTKGFGLSLQKPAKMVFVTPAYPWTQNYNINLLCIVININK